MLKPVLKHGSAVAGGVVLGLLLALGGAAWRLSQGPLPLNAFRPAVEAWLQTGVRGGQARVGGADLAWFGRSGSLGLVLTDVSLKDGKGRPVLQARRAEAGLALASLAGFKPAPGRIAAEHFFVALSISPEGRYALGYDASGAPGQAGDLLRDFEDLTGRPRAGRTLSFLKELHLSDGTVAFRQVGGPVGWRGRIAAVRFDKSGGRLDGEADLAVGEAALKARGSGLVGLKTARLDLQLSRLDPARLFPWVGATRKLSTLDALVDGRGALRWASDRGVQSADVSLLAGAGRVRLGGRFEPFQYGQLHAAFDPKTQRVLLETARAAYGRGDFDVSGQIWMVPERRGSGPARVEAALGAGSARLALAPGFEPQPIDGFAVRGRYVPALGRIEIDGLRANIAGAPLLLAGTLTRPKTPRSWGVNLWGRLDGLLEPRQVLAFWPDGLNDDVRSWLGSHIVSGRLGDAAFLVRLPVGAVIAHRPIPDSLLKVTWSFQDVAVGLYDQLPQVQQARGTAALTGDAYQMAVQSAHMQGVGLSEASVRIPWLMGRGKSPQVEVKARAAGDAREMLDIFDRAASRAISDHGLAPSRLSGRGDLTVDIVHSFDSDSLAHDQVTYRGQVLGAGVSDAAFGLSLSSPAIGLEGSLQKVSAKGEVRMGPYRGPLRFEAQFPSRGAASQKADFDGVLDMSTVGLQGPSGSTLQFSAHVDDDGQTGKAAIRSRAFTGQSTWRSGQGGRLVLQGQVNAPALRGVGVPISRKLPELVPARLILTRAGATWTGALEADAYSGKVSLGGGANSRLHYVADLTPAEVDRLGLEQSMDAARPTQLSLDVASSGDRGSASYALGAWLGQVTWSPATGSRTQYRWRATLTPAQMHAMGLPAAIHPRAPLPVDLVVTSAAGSWSGTVQAAGGSFRFSAVPLAGGRRRVTATGSADGAALANLGLSPPGMITGPAGLSAILDLEPAGLRTAHVTADLQRAVVSPPFTPWRKPAGRPMRLSADISRHDGVIEATALKGDGPGFALDASGVWRPASDGLLKVTRAKLEGAFDGALELAFQPEGQSLTVQGRYFDARRLIQAGGKSTTGPAGPAALARPLKLDAQLAQVRVTDQGMVRNVRLVGGVGGAERQKIELTVSRDDGGPLIDLRLTPDAAGMAINGQVTDVGQAAVALFGKHSFRGGQASVNGRLVQGGADLHVEMTKVRLIQAPGIARILTVGSLRGMADMLNGSGIEFTKVVAPVSIRGSKLNIGHARATGPAMGVTTQGVIDFDTQTVDLSGGIAPSYVLNSAIGATPLIGNIFVSRKGEGMFGLTYSAKGAFDAPKLSVNPLSIAAPGILRRLFEGRSAAEKIPAAEGG